MAVEVAIKVTDAIALEVARQNNLWGQQDHEDRDWLPILAEEFGEVGKAMAEFIHAGGPVEDIRTALIHTAAVAVQWLRAIERRSA